MADAINLTPVDYDPFAGASDSDFYNASVKAGQNAQGASVPLTIQRGDSSRAVGPNQAGSPDAAYLPAQPSSEYAEMKSYDPTLRERLTALFAGTNTERPSPERARVAEGLANIVGMTPAGIPMAAQEARQEAGTGNYVQAGLSAMAMMPAGGIAGKVAKATLPDIMRTADSMGISNYLSESKGGITLHKIVVPEDAQGAGLGTKFMQTLSDYADSTGQRIMLTPDSSFGGNVSRLKEFYKRFGFKENTGKSRDLSISQSMLREPSTNLQQAPSSGYQLSPVDHNPFSNAGQIAAPAGERGIVKLIPVDYNPFSASDMLAQAERAKTLGYNIDAYKGAHPYTGGAIRDWKGNVLSEMPQTPLHEFNSPGNPYAGYFSSDPQVASKFANALTQRGAVYPVKLKFDNPLTIDAKGKPAAAFQFESIAREHGTIDDFKNFKNALSGNEHDGIILNNTKDEAHVYVPKNAHQIRSKWANFDPNKIISGNIGD